MHQSINTWVIALMCFIVFTTDGRELPENENVEETSSEAGYNRVKDQSNRTTMAYNVQQIVRPASYSFFSSNVRDPAVRFEGLQPQFLYRHPAYPPPVREEPEERPETPILADHTQQQSFIAEQQNENRNVPVTRRTVRFPLNTVLPGNSLGFDHQPYPGLIQAVNTFSDLSPARQPQEGLVVTHNTVSLPPNHHGLTTASRTRISNQDAFGEGNYPRREFMETTHNTRGDNGNIFERLQQLRFHQGIDGDPAASYAQFKTGHGGGGKHFSKEDGQADEEKHSTSKGTKGERAYKKDSEHHKQSKGHHDKEQDAKNYEENLKKEKKYHKDEGFYGEHRKQEKGGKEKKYGEGGKHKKGHTTHGEHNVIKKDEYIKNTKFYDEDHGGGEHEEHGEFYGQHEENKGGNEKGKHKEDEYLKKNVDNKKYHDIGHVDEIHNGFESGRGHEQHYDHEEEFGGKKGGQTSKKWGYSSGDKH